MSGTKNPAWGKHAGLRQRACVRALSLKSLPHSRRYGKTRTHPAIRALDRMVSGQRPRRFKPTTPGELTPLVTAQAEALESYIYAHGVPTIRYTEDGHPRHYLWRAFGGKDYHDLEQMGWRHGDILVAMLAIHYRGGWIEGRYPGVLVVGIVDEHPDDVESDERGEAGDDDD